MKHDRSARLRYLASENARMASLYERNALTWEEELADAEAASELAAEAATERFFEDRAPTWFFGEI